MQKLKEVTFVSKTYLKNHLSIFIVNKQVIKVITPARYDFRTKQMVGDSMLTAYAINQANVKYCKQNKLFTASQIANLQDFLGLTNQQFANELAISTDELKLLVSGKIVSPEINYKLNKLLLNIK